MYGDPESGANADEEMQRYQRQYGGFAEEGKNQNDDEQEYREAQP